MFLPPWRFQDCHKHYPENKLPRCTSSLVRSFRFPPVFAKLFRGDRDRLSELFPHFLFAAGIRLCCRHLRELLHIPIPSRFLRRFRPDMFLHPREFQHIPTHRRRFRPRLLLPEPRHTPSLRRRRPRLREFRHIPSLHPHFGFEWQNRHLRQKFLRLRKLLHSPIPNPGPHCFQCPGLSELLRSCSPVVPFRLCCRHLRKLLHTPIPSRLPPYFHQHFRQRFLLREPQHIPNPRRYFLPKLRRLRQYPARPRFLLREQQHIPNPRRYFLPKLRRLRQYPARPRFLLREPQHIPSLRRQFLPELLRLRRYPAWPWFLLREPQHIPSLRQQFLPELRWLQRYPARPRFPQEKLCLR